MLTRAYSKFEAEIRSLYPELYSEDENTNRILHPDAQASAIRLAATTEVIQLYYPALLSSDSINKWRCQLDIAGRRQGKIAELADIILDDLQTKPEEGRYFEPVCVPMVGQGFSRFRVQFTLPIRRDS